MYRLYLAKGICFVLPDFLSGIDVPTSFQLAICFNSVLYQEHSFLQLAVHFLLLRFLLLCKFNRILL